MMEKTSAITRDTIEAIMYEYPPTTGRIREQCLDNIISGMSALDHGDFSSLCNSSSYAAEAVEEALERAFDIRRHDFVEKYISTIAYDKNHERPGSMERELHGLAMRDIIDMANSRLLAYYIDTRKIDVSGDEYGQCLSDAITNVGRKSSGGYHSHADAVLRGIAARHSGGLESYIGDAADKIDRQKNNGRRERYYVIDELGEYVVPKNATRVYRFDGGLEEMLRYQCYMLETLRIIKTLVERGARVDSGINPHKLESPLVRIAYVSPSACAVIAEMGVVDINAAGETSETAMSVAVRHRDAELVSRLAELGANIDGKIVADVFEALKKSATNDLHECESIVETIEALVSAAPPDRADLDWQYAELVKYCPEKSLKRVMKSYLSLGVRGLDEGDLERIDDPERRNQYRREWESIGEELEAAVRDSESESVNDIPREFAHYAAHNIYVQLCRDAEAADGAEDVGSAVVSCLAGAFDGGRLLTDSPCYIAVERYADMYYPGSIADTIAEWIPAAEQEAERIRLENDEEFVPSL